MAYATVTDVTKRLGRAVSSNDERLQITTWLNDAERLILRRIPDLEAKVEDGSICRDDVVLVEANAVFRKVKNPDGKQNERIDDYSYGLGDDAAKGEVFIADDEWSLLLSDDDGIDGAFTITPGGSRRTPPFSLTIDGWR